MLTTSSPTNLQSMEEFKVRLQMSIEDAKFALRPTKARQSAHSASKYNKLKYKISDKVWLKKTSFTDMCYRARTSPEDTARCHGTFPTIALVGNNALRLSIPFHLKLHAVVHVVHTIPHQRQPEDISNVAPLSLCGYPLEEATSSRSRPP